ncbi:anti-sigma factor [Herbidospora sp. NEAU-GS84]|uniref:Regulator of SigK n=1 Tax=Herbidospora solisilvae TaxID=2696284 RepID=A0A7C9JA89_9ACTN|nr:anti-sigma factor [Herbidospora solisilvae]NAS20761.1 anti-sigma factor [Herbidospora solisilvae]
MNDEIHTLSGAYALNALPLRELGEFEGHLSRCEACTIEVRGLQETAARLGVAVAEAPPRALKSRVMAQIAEVRQEPPPIDEEPPVAVVPLRRRPGRWALALAAVSAAAAVSVGVVAVNEIRSRDASIEETQSLLAAPDAVVRRVAMTGGGSATVVASESRGKVMFTSDLPALDPSRTYQLWTIGGERIRSAGLVDGGGVRTATVDLPPGTDHLGVTVEPAGGSEQPTTEPVMLAKVV